MRRLRQLFRNIHWIGFVGGEPLLHPDPATFINITRFAFPKSKLRFFTNGILLSKASAAFWDACRNTNTIIDVAVYPPMRNHIEKFRVLCEAEGVKARFKSIDTFHAHRNLKGDSDKKKAFKACRRIAYCPLLKQGRIYTCPMPAYVNYFNKSFNYRIAVDGGIDIHSKSISGLKILRKLNRPIETCRWCSHDIVQFPWATSNRLPADWDAAEVEKYAR
jgi:MoaA/NifB/PqqE/SkfB family radical SAM enzyme